jgi:putative glycosyltransferase
MRHACGRYVFVIDVDLEEQPEWLVDFWQDINTHCVDIVYGVQTLRAGSFAKRHTGAAFYRLFSFASDTRVPANVCTVRIMSKAYVDAITQFTESHIYLAGLYSWAGFTQRGRCVNKVCRPSKSTYTPIRLIRLFVHAVTSFSSYPLTLIFLAGSSVALVSFVYGCALLATKLLRPATIVSGFTSLMVSLWFLAGIIIAFLGVVGIYVGQIFNETKRRPQYFVKAVHGRDP